LIVPNKKECLWYEHGGRAATMSVQTDIVWTLRGGNLTKRFKEAIECFVEVLAVEKILTAYSANAVTT